MTAAKQTLKGPPLNRAEPSKIEVLDATERRIRMSVSSDRVAKLRERMFDEPWMETLGHGEGEVDLARYEAGTAPLMIDHAHETVRAQVGVVERAWVADGRFYNDVRFSKRDEVTPLWNDVADGIICNVSTTYVALERVLVKKNESGPSEYRVTRWMPYETSLVAVPADYTVGVSRSEDGVASIPADTRYIISSIDTLESRMADETTTADTAGTASIVASAPVVDVGKAERERCSAIAQLGMRHSADSALMSRAMDEGWSAEKFGLQLLESRAAMTPATAPSGRPDMQLPPKPGDTASVALQERSEFLTIAKRVADEQARMLGVK